MITHPTTILKHIQSRSSHPWLLDPHHTPLAPNFAQTFGHHYQHLQQTPPAPPFIIADANPIQFLAKFLAACATQQTVLLGNPKWVQSEWDQVQTICLETAEGIRQKAEEALKAEGRRQKAESEQPTPSPSQEKNRTLQNPKSKIQNPNVILIPTGGTSGTLRFAIHTWDTLTASVRGFQQHFQVDTINTFCVLPLYHVSGLMQFMRSFLSNGQMIISTFKHIEQSDTLDLDPCNYFLSLVPTQLARLYQNPSLIPLLRRFNAILLGGAPPWPDLLNTARQLQIPLAPTYGTTETASQVATLRPKEFLSSSHKALDANVWPHHGNNAGSVLPHAQICIRDPLGQPLPTRKTGLITIQAQSLALGYCSPKGVETIGAGLPLSSPRMFPSNDLGFLDEAGHLHIVGRQRDVIISGGENIAASEVEAAIRTTGWVKDVAVIGVSDRLWGEAVTAIYVPCEEGELRSEGAGGQRGREAGETEVELIKAALAGRLNRIKYPKHWIAVAELPRNPQGKVNRMELRAIAQASGLFVEGLDR